MKGLPVRPAFWTSAKPKEVLRKELGLVPDVKTVLLMGGGDGVGGLDTITKILAEKLNKSLKEKSQIVVICGSNKKLANELSSRPWPQNVTVNVKGFLRNIDEYMGSVDCLVSLKVVTCIVNISLYIQ